MLIFEPWFPSLQERVVSNFKKHLEKGKAHESRASFEFVALEFLLVSVCENLERRYAHRNTDTNGLLRTLRSSFCFGLVSGRFSMFASGIKPLLDDAFDSEGRALNRLLPIKYGLVAFETIVSETAKAIEDILEADEDMAEMYLTVKAKTGHRRSVDRHEDVEVEYLLVRLLSSIFKN